MMAHVQQILSSVPLLLFGLLSLLVWRRSGPVRRDRAALGWALTATAFLVVGTYSTAHSVLAAAGHMMGKESALYLQVYDWALAANLARALVSVVFGGMLLVLMLSRRRWAARVVAASPAVLMVTAILATVVLRPVQYPSGFAFLSTLAIVAGVTAIVMMAALFAAISSDGLDQLLWLALAIFTLKETMTVSFLAVIAAWTMDYAAAYFKVFYWVATVLELCMLAVAARRLYLAGGGQRVPAPFERVHAMRRPAHG
ncbi:MAG TPA: hypothetical protein VHG93_13060 [Longimicrobium sp.]|nr:hypothetical protein [Longimicrobium sp.]